MEKIHISTTNEKLGGQIASINMPAGVTCRSDAPCARLCYAMRGNTGGLDPMRGTVRQVPCLLAVAERSYGIL